MDTKIEARGREGDIGTGMVEGKTEFRGAENWVAVVQIADVNGVADAAEGELVEEGADGDNPFARGRADRKFGSGMK